MSAFFSGCETGFFRATRVRLQVDAMSGDEIARGLIWLTNNAAVFVATTLVGNNFVNYLTSLAAVLGAAVVWPAHAELLVTLTPIALSPVGFVYGELLPKNLFFQAPRGKVGAGGDSVTLTAPVGVPSVFQSQSLRSLLSTLKYESADSQKWILRVPPDRL